MRNIILVGASGHSKMIVDIIHKKKDYNIVGFVDSYKAINDDIYGYKILGKVKNLPDLKRQYNLFGLAIAIGDNYTRREIKSEIDALSLNLNFIPLLHPSAIIAEDIVIPNGTVIMPGVIINADAKIGEFCVLNTKSSLGHDSTMANFSSLASGATVGGNVTIGECSAISLNASIIQNVTIGNHTVIGAASLVMKPIGDYKLAYGNPVNTVKVREENSKYLS